MTRGRMSPAVILALLAVLGFCLGAAATEKPVNINERHSPAVSDPAPDPNWDLKEQMGAMPDVGTSVPDFDPNGKIGPRKGPAPYKQLPAASFLAEDFETSVPPPGWGLTSTHTDTMTWYQDDYNPYSGTYYADCKYDPDLVPQDEWLYTSVMDFESATTDLKVTFYWMMSYYWGVDPYDNYNLELWISTDAGANFTTKLWDEQSVGVFTSWEWYEAVVDLSSYVGEKDVVLAWRYVGEDGAQASLDLVSVNDDPPPPGRCCYGDPGSPSCDDITEADCMALADYISWDGDLNCTDDACPVAGPGDNCSSPITVNLPAALPYADNNYTCDRGDDYNATCLGSYDGGEDIIYEIVVASEVTVDITMDPLGATWTGMLLDDACPPGGSGECIDYTTGSSGSRILTNVTLAAGTYYLMIDTWPTPDCIPEFNLTIEEAAGPTPGDDCTDPMLVKLPDDLPYTNTNYTCGRIDDYSSTCLGSYDGGEDIIYELDVAATMSVIITFDPKGTTWTGVAVGSACPLGDPCLATSTSSSGSPRNFIVDLEPGLYYVMVDTWPSPTCIPDFDLTIEEFTTDIENDNCADATPVGDVTDLAFSTLGASYDGGGTCQSAPNIWYCYTAPCDGFATFSLCGSSYDTKMAVYDGCSCPPTTQLGCNDDACGLQSELMVAVVEGQQYLIEVGGYSSNSGDGVLNITTECGSPPPNDNCSDVTPVELTPGVTTTLTGNNELATNDCDALAPATEAWEAITLPEKMDLVIDYCGTAPAFELVYIVLANSCPCGELVYATATDWDLCGDGNVTMYFPGLDAGTYYIPVLSFHPDYPYSSYYYSGDYNINVLGTSWVPHYCDAAGNTFDEYIERVQLADIDNTSSWTGYADYTDQIANLQFGVGYPITVTIGSSWSSDAGAVWIDWNQDYDFDDPGEAITLDVSTGYGPYTGTINVPADATAGVTRMRVRLVYASTPLPCGTTTYGEVEDYSVNVGGEQSELTIDPPELDLGIVPPGAAGSAEMTLGAIGSATINFSIAVEYVEKASFGGGEASDPTLKANPFEGEPAIPATEKGANQLLFEGFESGTVPPPGWSAEVNNAYTWEIGTYAPYEGTYYATCFYDETYTGTQDEWLISPTIDFGGSKYVLDFWWNASYYWGVDPYDNYDLEVWVSLDGGSTWSAKLWDEDGFGEFTNWEWYNVVIDLSSLKDENNVKLGFHYAGYDGAQGSFDAIALNPAPLNWLSVSPEAGTIPGDGSVPVTVSYDATDLDEQLYEANLIINHTGAPTKTTDVVPVSMLVSSVTPEIDPWPMYILYAYALDPMVGHVFLREEHLEAYPGYALTDIDPATITIDGDASMIIGDPDFPAESFFDVSFSVEDFLLSYGPIWGTVMLPYTVEGSFNDATAFVINREVECFGLFPGDANLDGMVNVGDAVFMVNFVFRGGENPRFEPSADSNCDGALNIADAVKVVNYVFRNGSSPCHQ